MRTSRIRRTLSVAIVAALGSAACSSDESSSPPTISASPTAATTGATSSVEPTGTGSTAPAGADTLDTETPSTTPATMNTATSALPTAASPPPSAAETTLETSAATSVVSSPDSGESLPGMRRVVETLAADDLNGRDNGTPGSVAAQDFLIGELMTFAQPLPTAGAATAPTGADAYRHAIAVGTNLIGVIPGTDLADQYVIVGAHYDHLGNDCTPNGTDNICNGATDNATGTAVALAVARAIAGGATPPRRSVIIALWDAEEDGLLGSAAYVGAPLVPLAQTIAYVNFDIQGTNISPALTNATVMVGAETGGPNLVAAALAAAKASSLQTVPLSLLFGQGRSDHAQFAGARVPSVFFTDATPPCYHTAGDDISIVDFPKLAQQQATAEALVRDLASTDSVPVFDGAAPLATYEDAVSMHGLLLQAQPDFVRFSAEDRVSADRYVADLDGIVGAGPEAFDDAAVGTLLSGALGVVSAWANGVCEGFLSPTG